MEWISLNEDSISTSPLWFSRSSRLSFSGLGLGYSEPEHTRFICLHCSYFPRIKFNFLLGVLAFGGSFGAVNRRAWRCLSVLAEYEF
jgi:hypothetical protein